MSQALLVGVDVGTTSCKVTVCTTDGREVTNAKAALTWQVTHEGVEVDPAAILDAVAAATGAALAEAPPGEVLAVGVASMGEAGVLLDQRGEPLAPVIAWHDDRDRALAERMGRELGETEFTGATGLPVISQWSLSKHRWLVEHHSHSAGAVRRLGIAEWVVRALGGEEASEYSLASRTGWLRLDTGEWWPEALEWSGARASLLPSLVRAGSPLGRVNASWAPARLTGAVLTVAGHDHLAAAVGAGAVRDGDQLDSCGTAEALVRTVSAPLPPDPVRRLVEAGVTVGHHVLPGRLSVLGDRRGGLLMQNVQRLLGFGSAELADFDERALACPTGSLTADLEDDGNVVLRGIGRDASPAQLWHTALRSAADRAIQMDSDMSAVLGAHQRTVMSGGWTRSRAVRQLRGAAWKDVTVAQVQEAGGRGAALLGGCAAGLYAGPEDLPPAPVTAAEPAVGHRLLTATAMPGSTR
ncbi:L-fuculokinase [Streptomyces sp. NPDC096311]|uniref:FGGY-family carbohydrate kinase n=1 Tax=Streptomyces sp. NPDC096311 TaxID=3366083 RepID=UPI003814CC02